MDFHVFSRFHDLTSEALVGAGASLAAPALGALLDVMESAAVRRDSPSEQVLEQQLCICFCAPSATRSGVQRLATLSISGCSIFVVTVY